MTDTATSPERAEGALDLLAGELAHGYPDVGAAVLERLASRTQGPATVSLYAEHAARALGRHLGLGGTSRGGEEVGG